MLRAQDAFISTGRLRLPSNMTHRAWYRDLRPWLEDAGGWLALALLVFTLVTAAWLGLGWGGPRTAGAFAMVAPVIPAAVIVLLSWRTSQLFDLSAERRRAWGWIVASQCCYLVATIGWAAVGLMGGVRTPSIADPLFLLCFPLSAVAFFWLLRSTREEPLTARFWLDAATVLLSFGAFLWFYVVEPALAAINEEPLERALALLYASCDSVLFLLTVIMLLRERNWRNQPAIAWLAAGMTTLLSSNLLWVTGILDGHAAPQVLIVVLQVGATAMLALAAQAEFVVAYRLEQAPGADAHPRRLVNLVPFAGLALAMAMLVHFQFIAWSRIPVVMTLVVCAVGILVMVRQALVADEVAKLRARLALRAAEARFASLVRNSTDVIAVSDRRGRFQYCTTSAERVFGISPDQLTGRHLPDLVSEDDRHKVTEFFSRTLDGIGATGTLELHVPRGDSRERVLEVVGTNLAHDEAVGGCVLNMRDVTERRTLEEQLKRLAFHDPLTLLANRALFRDRVEHALASGKRQARRVAVIFVDLDNFKKINDSLGHGQGDRVLRTSAQRLAKCTRAGDTVARLGGDEFAVLIDDAQHDDKVLEVAGRIVEALREPFSFLGTDIRVAASVGIAFGGDDDTVEELLRNADVAMYHAKSQGKSRYAVFQQQMQQAVRDRLRVEAELSRAITRNEFRVHYQPVVDLESGYLIGVEALVRWQHPERGLVSPAEFINIAEDTGQVLGIGRWVLRQACNEVRQWQERMPRGRQLRVAVNVSGRQLQNSDLVAEVEQALQESGLDPGTLVIEMTESVIMQHTEATLAKLTRLKRLGVRIAIDDFGTGYSSLAYLHRFPIDILKIDRAFVQRLGDERDGAELARAIITLGDALGLEVVAEGIEQEHQQRELLELGCVAGQGYYYGKPAPLEDISRSMPARLRQQVTADLPDTVILSATGRFRREDIDHLMRDMEATGTFGR